MSWKALITDAGNELSAKTISGGNIKLTHAKAGSGTVSEQDLHLQTELVNVKQTLSIESIKYSNAVNNIEILLDCRGLKEAYDLTQIGIYATDPDAGEILFAIAQTENPKHIPAENEVPFYSIDFNFAFVLKNNQNMVATIDQSTFATKEQLSAVDARIDNIIVNAGSTEDNAELIDMRVDVDGKRHSTAGEALRSQLKQKANLTDISSPYQFRGACLSANLPGSGNKINDTYYVTDKKCKFTWNGAAWYQSSLNESDYEEELSSLTEDIGELDNTVNSLTCAKKWWKNNQVIPKGLLNISNIEFYGIFADCDLSIYNAKVNADGSFSLAISYFDYYNGNKKQERTYGVTLSVSEEYQTRRIDIDNGRYINFTYRTKGNKIGKILGEEEHIYVEYETESNSLTQEDHVVDYRAFRECHVSNSVTKVTIKRIQNIDTSISGSTYPYYALYQIEYKDGTSNIFERYSETLLSGLQTETFDNDVVLIFDADVIGYYATGFQNHSIALCEKAYVRDIETATETEEDLFYEYNLFDYDFISLLDDVKEIKMTNGASAVRDISRIAKGKKYCYRLGFLNTGDSDIDFELPVQSLEGLQEVVVRVYMSSLEGITDATVFIVTDYWDSTIPTTVTLKEGVNEIRITLADKWHIRDYQDLMDKTWSKIKVRLSPTKANTHAYLLDIVSVKPQKAKILFIDDHAYKNFMDVGYPQLKALKIPVTWGVKIEFLNKPVEYASRIINEEEVESLASDSYSEINFHSYYGIGTSSMSADECRDDVAKAQRWLRKRGFYREPAFRSAWVQNKAKNARATDDMLDFSATYTADETIACFPFKDNHNIPRVAVHYGKEFIDLWFNALKLSHGIMVIYTHDISDLETSDPIHCSTEKWNYFISKLTGAINEGWLEGVTMSGLMTKYRRTF